MYAWNCLFNLQNLTAHLLQLFLLTIITMQHITFLKTDILNRILTKKLFLKYISNNKLLYCFYRIVVGKVEEFMFVRVLWSTNIRNYGMRREGRLPVGF